MKKIATNNLIFPLCLLDLKVHEIRVGGKGKKNTSHPKYGNIISYSIVRYATILSEEYDSVDDIGYDHDEILAYVDENGVDGYNDKKVLHRFIVLVAMAEEIDIHDMEGTLNRFKLLDRFIKDYESAYGKDALVKVHKDLLFETRDGKFDERVFRVYCAIVSLIGNKSFRRITINEIRYRMQGFKSKTIYETELSKRKDMEKLTDRQIKTITDKLQKYNFVDKVTFNRRFTYYSKKLRGDKLLSEIGKVKAIQRFQKERSSIASIKLKTIIEDEFNKIKKAHLIV